VQQEPVYGVRLVALFLDAIFLNVRPKGPKEGVLCAWGFTEEGERVLVGICLGMRESHEDWLCLARDLIARGLGAPMLVVADGAPGLDLQINNACNGVKLSDIDRQKLYRLRHEPGQSEAEREEAVAA
jgi:transposase-like protein